MTTRSLLTALILAALATAACQSTPKTPPSPAAINDAKAPSADRTRAIEAAGAELKAGEGDVAATRESLKTVIWKRSNYWKLRAAALDALLQDQAHLADTRHMLVLLLPTESILGTWHMLEYIGNVAVKRKWTDLTPGFVVSYAHKVPSPEDPDRPERKAIEGLYPDRPVTDVVFDVFVGRYDANLSERERLAAWGLLCRLDESGGHTTQLLAQLDTTTATSDPLLTALHAAATDLHAVPETGDQLEWVKQMRSPDHKAFWTECASAIARLSPEQLDGFALRDAAGVRWAATYRPEWLTLSRDALMQDVAHNYDDAKHVWRTGGANTQVDESLRRAKDKLAWGDCLLILIADEALQDDQLIPELFDQADQDRDDTSTEYGGVIDAAPASTSDAPRFVAYSYPPRPAQRLGDNRFVASDDLLNAGVAALFHYHFHCPTYSNREYAGPSMGDLEYARQYGRSCIVFTFADRNTLNADYYQPNGARVDLGSITRP